ncbi:MAG: Septum formation protein Maf [Phycisphaerae bacterium]|nr:Septum formation protein Maf [Phycisphaerae bacterium]
MNSTTIDNAAAGPREGLASLTLVSNSPQRAMLLRQAGYRFEVVPPALHEPEARSPKLTPAEHAQALAYFKARSVADRYPDRLLLGADTIVAVGDEVLGKPAGRDDARRMLRLITSAPHRVITGVALLAPMQGHRVIADAVTEVFMRPLADGEMEAYLDSGAWQDKAGAYGLQAGADAFVQRIDGSTSNVIGLPMELLERLLGQFGG